MPEIPNNPSDSSNTNIQTGKSWESWKAFGFFTRRREQNQMVSLTINYKVCLVSDDHLTHIEQLVSHVDESWKYNSEKQDE